MNHDAPGHLGICRTQNLVNERYFWPGMTQDIKDYVKACAHCRRHQPPSVRSHDVF